MTPDEVHEAALKLAHQHNPTIEWHQFNNRMQDIFREKARVLVETKELVLAYVDAETDLTISQTTDFTNLIAREIEVRNAAWEALMTKLEELV